MTEWVEWDGPRGKTYRQQFQREYKHAPPVELPEYDESDEEMIPFTKEGFAEHDRKATSEELAKLRDIKAEQKYKEE